MLGLSIGLLVAAVLCAIAGKRFGVAGIGIALGCGSIAVAIADAEAKVKSIEEINRPLTLGAPTSTRTPSGEESPGDGWRGQVRQR